MRSRVLRHPSSTTSGATSRRTRTHRSIGVAAAPGGPATWYDGAASRATATPVALATTAVEITLTLTTP